MNQDWTCCLTGSQKIQEAFTDTNVEEYLGVSGSFSGTVASVGLISDQIYLSYFSYCVFVHLESPYSASVLRSDFVGSRHCCVFLKMHFIGQDSGGGSSVT